MSTYEPGRLYLIDVYGVTRTVHYCADGWFRCGEDFGTTYGDSLNVRPAVVLDPEGEDVKAFTDPRHDPADYAVAIAVEIRAQITPPEPPMEEPGWGEKVADDRGHWLHAYGPVWTNAIGNTSAWAEMVNPRPYENPRERPAKGPESDAQGCTGCVPPHVIVNDAEVYDGEDRP